MLLLEKLKRKVQVFKGEKLLIRKLLHEKIQLWRTDSS